MDIQMLQPLAWVAAAISAVYAARNYHRQINTDVVMKYTERYERIMSSFPKEARQARFNLDGEPPEPSPDLTECVLKYLNLCSEEFYLRSKKYISKGAWEIWECDLKCTLRSPLFRREWQTLRREFECHPKFVEYVERVHREL